MGTPREGWDGGARVRGGGAVGGTEKSGECADPRTVGGGARTGRLRARAQWWEEKLFKNERMQKGGRVKKPEAREKRRDAQSTGGGGKEAGFEGGNSLAARMEVPGGGGEDRAQRKSKDLWTGEERATTLPPLIHAFHE